MVRLNLLFFAVTVILFTLPHYGSSSFHHEPHYTEEERENWFKAVDLFHLVSHPHKNHVINILREIVAETKITMSPGCRIGLRDFAAGISTGNLSQMLMFDSFSKPLGIMSSQGFNLGSHRQCLKEGRYVLFGIRFPIPEDESITKLDPNDPENADIEEWIIEYSKHIGFFRGYPYYASICVPDACSESDVISVFNSSLVMDHIEPLKLELSVSESYSDDWNITFMQVIYLLMFSGFVNTCFLSTVIIYFFPDWDLAARLQPFDLIQNSMNLWSDRKTSSNENLTSAFDLFRVIHLLFGFFSHVIFGMSSILLFRTQVFTSSYTPSLEDFFKGIPVSIGFTLIISASLSTYHWLRIMSTNKDEKISFIRFALPKLLRPIPMMMYMIVFYSGMPMIPFIGPFGKLVQQDMSEKCFAYGWREISFINNFYPVDQVCNLVNWIVAVDVQLYLGSFVILSLMSKNAKAGLATLAAVIIAGTIGSGIYSINNNIHAYINLNIDQVYNTISSLHKVMYHTIHYVPVYGIGMLLGYILFTQEGKKREIPMKYLMTSIVPLASLTYLSAIVYDEEYNFFFGTGFEVIYTTIVRLVSAVCTAILFYAFLNTSHPVITYITDSKIIIVTSRLAYCMFASHSIIVNMILASLETQLTTTLFLILMYLSVLVFGFMFANILHVLVEAPCRNVLANILSVMDNGGTNRDKKSKTL